MPRARAIWPFAAVLAAAAVTQDAVAVDSRGFLYGRVETTTRREPHRVPALGRPGDRLGRPLPVRQDRTPLRRRPRDPPRIRPNPSASASWASRSSSETTAARTARIVSVRFGDLAAILPRGEGKATLRLKSGDELEVEGYADDVSSDVVVTDPAGGEVKLAWQNLASVTFLPVPPGAARGAHRLFGEVESDAGTFVGFIAWDKSLGLSTDLLEGESGGERVELAMGDVAAINRIGQQRCEITLRDGRELTLRGTRHVSRGNRGVLVEDARYGKVEIPWDTFDKMVLRDPPGSGPGYD